MKCQKMRSLKARLALGLVLLCLVLVTGPAVAGPITYTIDKNVVSNGGGAASGGAFTLNGTVGQGADMIPMSGGTFTLSGGYWTGMPSVLEYFPAVKK